MQFIFTAQLSSGETLSASDQWQTDYLDPVKIVSTEFQSSGSLFAQWNGTEGAEYYQIRMLDQGGNAVYLSQSLSSSTTSYTITTGNGEWTSGYSPSTGEVLTLEVVAYLFDYMDAGKLQSLSMADTTLEWQNYSCHSLPDFNQSLTLLLFPLVSDFGQNQGRP